MEWNYIVYIVIPVSQGIHMPLVRYVTNVVASRDKYSDNLKSR